MPALLVHALYVGFVVLVAVLQGLVTVFDGSFDLALLELLKSRNRAEFIKDFMLLLESKGG